MHATCIGLDNDTAEAVTIVGSPEVKHVELESASPLCHWHLDGSAPSLFNTTIGSVDAYRHLYGYDVLDHQLVGRSDGRIVE